VTDVDAALKTQIRNIEATYGQPVEHWFAVIDGSGLSKHNEVVAFLKTEHGLPHGAAHRLSLLARDRPGTATTAASDPAPDPVSALYSGRKAGLRPLHDQLMAIVQDLGSVEISPKKGYLSPRRRKQFAMIQPSAASRIDLGLILPPDTAASDRLEPADTWNALFTHRVRLISDTDLDDHLRGWLSAAYAAAA
jgi:Domain of unknown function (DUF4287)/Domain of unknown function (DUF5655)